MICATCSHWPGNGALCPVAHVHATHHRRNCHHHLPAPSAAHVATLRHLAVDWLRAGDNRRYAANLNAAHAAAEAARR